MTMAGAIAFWKSGQPSISNARDDPAWSNVLTFAGLAFISASLGVQGILGKRLNTQFGTTSTFSLSVYYHAAAHQRNSRADHRMG
jgi:hypothetical protein